MTTTTTASLSREYGKLSPRERMILRGRYAKEQGGKCMWCEAPLDGGPAPHVADMKGKVNWNLFPGGRLFLKYPVHLQHDHETGMTEGAVHALCNAVMWQFHGR